jgi:hypothetical protein
MMGSTDSRVLDPRRQIAERASGFRNRFADNFPGGVAYVVHVLGGEGNSCAKMVSIMSDPTGGSSPG